MTDPMVVVEMLSRGRTDLADLEVRSRSVSDCDLFAKIIAKIDNFEDDPDHICCDCEREQDDSIWGNCPNCYDRSGEHCLPCEKLPGWLKKIRAVLAGEKLLSVDGAKALEEIFEKIDRAEERCDGAE